MSRWSTAAMAVTCAGLVDVLRCRLAAMTREESALIKDGDCCMSNGRVSMFKVGKQYSLLSLSQVQLSSGRHGRDRLPQRPYTEDVPRHLGIVMTRLLFSVASGRLPEHRV